MALKWLTMRRVLATIAVIVGFIGVSVTATAIHTSWDAEKTLHAYIIVLDVTQQFVETNEGRWPQNWEVLESFRPRIGGIWEWPQDTLEIQRRITIDFQLTAAELAAMTPEGFTAVTQRSPRYDAAEAQIQLLLHTLQRHSPMVEELR